MVLGLSQKEVGNEQKGVRVCIKVRSGQKGCRRWIRNRIWQAETERKREESG